MVRLSTVAVLVSALAAAAAPLQARQAVFKEQAYAQFQISSGTAGNAEAKANAVFVDPFKGQDLATISKDTIDALSAMREAAEDAETSLFNPAIDAAGGTQTTEGKALQNGKIQNKVLKLTGFNQVLKIKIAQGQAAGKDTSSDEAKLDEEAKKLANNIATDKKNAGAASKAVA